MGSPAPPPPPGSQPASPHPQIHSNGAGSGGGAALVDPALLQTGPAVLGAEQQAGQYATAAAWQPTSPTTHLETLALVEQNR